MARQLKGIPQPVVRRLPKYLTQVQDLRKAGVEWASSQDLAEALGLTSSTVRQDLSHLDILGISKRGYEVAALERALVGALGGGRTWKVAVVGAGNLGCALAANEEFREKGFDVCALVDTSPRVIGRKVGRLTVEDVAALAEIVRERGVGIAMLAVPASAAQEAADKLVAAGVRGLLNLARAHLRVPAGVAVVDAGVLENLQELSYLLHLSRA
ncbi:MAG: redox-sensing transcriptional repressor Rex [Kiritimatiellae bacterium]|nr:redox-sensing transcriptional repressor Rex [Kiritimatiellia bacterium]